MFAIPGLLGMLLFIVVRPHDLNPALAGLPSLQVFASLAFAGFVIDIRRLHARHYTSPQLTFVLLFALWCILSLVPTRPDTITTIAPKIAIMLIVYGLTAFSSQSFRKLAVVAGFFGASCLFVAIVVTLQGFGDRECFEEDPQSTGDSEVLLPDGRPCEFRAECGIDGNPGQDYRCEKRGPFGTASVAGRVRYVGVLRDPNETSLACGLAVPIALCFFELRRNWRRRLLVVVTLVFVGLATYFSQSRGGQLVFASVLATYLYRRNGVRGLLIAGLLAMPILLFGGRSGGEADGSALERLECWFTGMQLLRVSPIWGVGCMHFTDYHYLTAHNSFILVSAEMGLIGLTLFVGLIYTSAKQLLVAMNTISEGEYALHVRSWAVALFAALIGASVGIFFLSFAYHLVLWVLFGLIAAFYGIVRAHYPEWRVQITRVDLASIVGISAVLTVVLYLYTKIRVT